MIKKYYILVLTFLCLFLGQVSYGLNINEGSVGEDEYDKDPSPSLNCEDFGGLCDLLSEKYGTQVTSILVNEDGHISGFFSRTDDPLSTGGIELNIIGGTGLWSGSGSEAEYPWTDIDDFLKSHEINPEDTESIGNPCIGCDEDLPPEPPTTLEIAQTIASNAIATGLAFKELYVDVGTTIFNGTTVNTNTLVKNIFDTSALTTTFKEELKLAGQLDGIAIMGVAGKVLGISGTYISANKLVEEYVNTCLLYTSDAADE